MRFLLTTLSLVLMFAACKKDKSNPAAPAPAQPVVYDDYIKAKPGNYWIYQRFTLDSIGQHLQNRYDSIWVHPDTVIDGYTYHRFGAASLDGSAIYDDHPLHYSRDSLHFAIGLYNQKPLMSTELFDAVFLNYYLVMSDTTARIERSMSSRDSVITTPAGTFSTITALDTWHMYPGFQQQGPLRYTFSRYAKGVGLVEEVLYFYIGSPNYEGRTLVRYHIEP